MGMRDIQQDSGQGPTRRGLLAAGLAAGTAAGTGAWRAAGPDRSAGVPSGTPGAAPGCANPDRGPTRIWPAGTRFRSSGTSWCS